MTGKTSIYDTFVSSENLKLAWERVRYFDRPDSRDWIGLKVFAANRDYNLELLRKTLVARTFEPTYPEIKYLPKKSQTLRPMAIMAIADRVIFQAIANVAAERARPVLSTIADRQSYANVLAETNSKGLFKPWKPQYQSFQKKFKALFEEGNIWLVETDMAAFYETIDHEMLFKTLTDNEFLDAETREYLETYLPIWASAKREEKISRGLPQGCLASDLFANIFLLKFDKKLSVQEFHYLRYVDDIRLLASTREAVQKGLICVDRNLKMSGLLIQTNKTLVRQISNFDDEADRLAAQLSEIDRAVHELEDLPESTLPELLNEPSLGDIAKLGDSFSSKEMNLQTSKNELQEKLKDLFWQSKEYIDSFKEDPFAERHLKFCLYRLEADPEITEAVLPYLVTRPWLSESLHSYLRKTKLETVAIQSLIEIISTHKVYDIIPTFAIETLIRQRISLRSLHATFRKWLTDNNRDWALLAAAATALGENIDNMSVLLNVISSSSYSPSVRRAALIQALRTKDKYEALGILKLGIDSDEPLLLDTLLYLLYVERSSCIRDLSLNEQKLLSEYCLAIAKGYDDSLPHREQCYIKYILAKKYMVKVTTSIDFYSMLGEKEHKRASGFLWQAETSYLSNPSRYVSQLNLFHEELLYPIFVDKLQLKSSKEDAKSVALRNKLDMILKKIQSEGEPKIGTFISVLLDCNDLRAKGTEAHTRLHGSLDFTTSMDWHQRDSLKKRLCGAY